VARADSQEEHASEGEAELDEDEAVSDDEEIVRLQGGSDQWDGPDETGEGLLSKTDLGYLGPSLASVQAVQCYETVHDVVVATLEATERYVKEMADIMVSSDMLSAVPSGNLMLPVTHTLR
jgi:hypothetical protein